MVFTIVVFFMPEVGGYFLEYNNFIPADPMKTPPHIAPVWYFTPYYAMLRAVPAMFGSQFPGVIVMGAGVVIFFLLPWLDRGKVKSIRYRGPLFRGWLYVFIVSFVILGWLGVKPTDFLGKVGSTDLEWATLLARIFTIVYFLFFLLMPFYTAIDREQPEPDRVTG
jgi:ubiquinol-cytochrome c reductase cytochrome b subunit